MHSMHTATTRFLRVCRRIRMSSARFFFFFFFPFSFISIAMRSFLLLADRISVPWQKVLDMIQIVYFNFEAAAHASFHCKRLDLITSFYSLKGKNPLSPCLSSNHIACFDSITEKTHALPLKRSISNRLIGPERVVHSRARLCTASGT